MYRLQTAVRWILISICVFFFMNVLIYHFTVSKNAIKEEVEMPDWQFPAPETFCPPFHANESVTKRIFFIDIPCNRSACLTPRSVCGIESTARANPGLDIGVYILTGKRRVPGKRTLKRPRPGQVIDCQVTNVLSQFANVRILKQDLRFALNITLGPKGSGLLFDKEGDWTSLHAKEVLKLALLKAFGGVYLDTNVVSFRPLHCLRNTVVYFNRTNTLGNQVLIFDKEHPFLEFALRSLKLDYEPNRRDSMGAARLAEAFEVFCNTSDHTEFHSGRGYSCHKNSHINLIGDEAFFPIDRLRAIKFFEPRVTRSEAASISARLSRSYLAHVDSAGWGLSAPATSLYATLARRYCPSTWEAVQAKSALHF